MRSCSMHSNSITELCLPSHPRKRSGAAPASEGSLLGRDVVRAPGSRCPHARLNRVRRTRCFDPREPHVGPHGPDVGAGIVRVPVRASILKWRADGERSSRRAASDRHKRWPSRTRNLLSWRGCLPPRVSLWPGAALRAPSRSKLRTASRSRSASMHANGFACCPCMPQRGTGRARPWCATVS